MLVARGVGPTAATSSSGTRTATATSNLCQGAAHVNQALASLSRIGPNTTVGKAQAQQSKLRNAPEQNRHTGGWHPFRPVQRHGTRPKHLAGSKEHHLFVTHRSWPLHTTGAVGQTRSATTYSVAST